MRLISPSIAVGATSRYIVMKAIDAAAPAGGILNICDPNGVLLAAITLDVPSGTTGDGAYILTTPLIENAVVTGGYPQTAQTTDGNGNLVVSGLVNGVDFGVSPNWITSGEAIELSTWRRSRATNCSVASIFRLRGGLMRRSAQD
jgi:hypothetical protein